MSVMPIRPSSKDRPGLDKLVQLEEWVRYHEEQIRHHEEELQKTLRALEVLRSDNATVAPSDRIRDRRFVWEMIKALLEKRGEPLTIKQIFDGLAREGC